MKKPYFPQLKNSLSAEEIKRLAYLRVTYGEEFLQEIRAKYFPWEEFRYKFSKLPEVDLNLLWYSRKSFYRKQKKIVLIKDKEQQPFGYVLSDLVIQLLREIDIRMQDPFKFLPQTKEAQLQTEWKDKSLVRSLMEEAITSAQIEGAATTRPVAQELLRTGRKPRNKHERMIVNNFLTMKEIKSNYVGKALSPELIKEIHRWITEDTLEFSGYGVFRTRDDIKVFDRDNEVLHDPPSYEKIPELIENLCVFINNEKEFIHPVLKGIILHFYLAYIHPFEDGNGRTARALFYWYLLKQNYSLVEYVSISELIKKTQDSYLRAFLHTEEDENDLTYFIVYSLRIISSAIKGVEQYISRKLKEHDEIVTRLRTIKLNIRQYDLLHYALAHKDAKFTVKSHQTSNNTSRPTAYMDLQELVQKGYLEVSRLGKEAYYFPVAGLSEKI